MNIKKIRLLIIGFVIGITFIGGFIIYYSQLRIKSRASAGVPTLSFVTNPILSSATGNFDLILRVNPNNATFNAFEFQFIIDPSKVDFLNKTDINSNIIEISPNKLLRDQTKVDLVNNKIIIVGFRDGDTGITGWTDVDMVKVSMKLLPGAALPVLFTWDSATKIGANITTEKINASFPESGVSPTGDVSKKGSIYFGSGKSSYVQSENINIDVFLSTEGEQVKASDIYIPFDNTKFDFQNSGDISKNVQLLTGTGFNLNSSLVVLNEGKIRITLLTPVSGGNPVPVQGNDIKVATILVKGKVVGSVPFSADLTNSNIYTMSNKNILGKAPSYTITVVEQATVHEEISPTPETVKSNGDLININSSPLDRAPFRYEQQVVLDKGSYTLKASALTYLSRGRGVLVTLACAENNCGNGKTLNNIIAETPKFPVSTEYKEQITDINITEEGKNKKYMVRIFTEDGSEADFDYVSLTNQWDGEQLKNIHFDQTEDTSISRKHPQMWEMDAPGKLFSTVDPNKGVQGALYINSISRQ